MCVRSSGHLSCYLVQPAPGIDYTAEEESPIDCYVKVRTAHASVLEYPSTLDLNLSKVYNII